MGAGAQARRMTDATAKRKPKKVPLEDQPAEALMDGAGRVRPKSDIVQ